MLQIRRGFVTLATTALTAAGMFFGVSPLYAGAVAQPGIYVNDMIVGEADGSIAVVVRLDNPGLDPVSVNYTTGSVTAGVGDFTGKSGVLNFVAGDESETVLVDITNDAGAEGYETFNFTISSPSSTATIARATGSIGIIDNDTVVATPRLFVRDAVVDEGDGTASIPVLLGGPIGERSNSTVTVVYATANAGATAGSDYTAASGTLTFAPGDTVKTVIVDITDDSAPEPFERFNLTLSSPTNATIADGRGVVVIGASDATKVAQPGMSVADVTVGEADGYLDMVVSLSAPGLDRVTANFTTGSVTAGINDFSGFSGQVTFASGQTTRVLRIEFKNDATPEPYETFNFTISSPSNATIAKATATIGIVDNDNGVNVYSYGISNDIYTVVLASDVIVENPGGGTDTVQTSLTYILGPELENLTLTGAAAVNGTGNAANNVLTGNGAANVLKGLAGNDKLIGGGGPDTLTGGPGTDTITVGTGSDIIVFDSLSGSDTVTDFNHASDTFRFSQAGIHIGDGDAVVEGAVTRSAPGGFAKTAELGIFTTDIVGAITTTTAAATIGSATSAYAIGDDRLFVVDNGTSTGIFRFRSSAANALVSASELKLVALVSYEVGTTATTISDYTFAP